MDCSALCPSLEYRSHPPRSEIQTRCCELRLRGFESRSAMHRFGDIAFGATNEQSRVEPRVSDVRKLEVATVSGPSLNVG